MAMHNLFGDQTSHGIPASREETGTAVIGGIAGSTRQAWARGWWRIQGCASRGDRLDDERYRAGPATSQKRIPIRPMSQLGCRRAERQGDLSESGRLRQLLLAVLLPLGSGGVGMALFGLGNAGLAANVVVFSIITRTYRQNASPPDLLSRVMATVRFVSWGAIPVGALLAGVLAGATSPRMALWASVLVLVTPIMLAWVGPLARVRDLEDVPTLRP